MTLIDTLPPRYTRQPRTVQARTAQPRTVQPRMVHARHAGDQGRRRPMAVRPAGAPMRPSSAAVPMSRAPHRRRRAITPVTTVGLALLAALITVWLGAVAQFGEAIQGATVPGPSKLAVVQVQMGETLQTVAARIAPDAPVGQTVERIRELNELDGAAVNAGQTLIAPVG
ncbi:LysM peptidoglycan-binding domain-containing protein [Mycolicibacterium mengxianglii]|uniref:LysM peptidoglycan-binding domain-containing protein n=1 Tax=Mycolicibacterium mengxianglii TaxID=2736649 RepID=UPI0038CC0D19